MQLIKKAILCVIGLTLSVFLSAQIILTEELDSVVITAKPIKGIRKKTSNDYIWEMKDLKSLPKILGNADPLHYIQYLPGIQISSEYDAGLHIQGCDNEHNEVSIFGVPLYQVSHLLGLFSIFNPSHFPSAQVSMSHLATSSNKLGGRVDMNLIQNTVSKIQGEFSISPISSQGTLQLPLSKKLTLATSARVSYLNLLYKPWLKVDKTQLLYNFSDYNLTCIYVPDLQNKVWINTYFGQDKVNIDENLTRSSIDLKWSNFLLSAHWKHKFSTSDLTQFVYTTQYKNKLLLTNNTNLEKLPAGIQDLGYQAHWSTKFLDITAKAVWHSIQLQRNKRWEKNLKSSEKEQHSQEYTLVAYTDWAIDNHWKMEGGLKGCLYRDPFNKNHIDILPQVGINYSPITNYSWKLIYGYQKQYLFQTGFTDMGMPTEFWISCNSKIPPQSAHSISLATDISLFNGDWSISSSIYYKKLNKQVEYIGNILDLMDANYKIENELLSGKGKNYGISILFHKRTGKLTGWIGYTLSRALRYFNHPDFPTSYPANHERIHELKSLVTYSINKRWEIGSSLVLASGTPFTAPEHFYLNNGHVITEFGPHNANRLKPYFRLDLSANYRFKTTSTKERGLNFSVYNATMYTNYLFYRVKFKNREYAYKPMKFILFAMPSISFYQKF